MGEPHCGSEIADFYKSKSILITGATGFLGKLLVEQLLRKCEPKKLYLLIRTKKNVNPELRLEEIFKFPVFDRVKKMNPNYLDYVEVIDGDVSKPNLGLSPESLNLIIQKVEVVFHGAANVKFKEHIKLATSINVSGTKNITLLCHRIKNLKAFVHISTAFSHCISQRKKIGEDFYDTPLDADNLIKLTESLPENKLSEITETVLDSWPNTYTFTKAVAENGIKINGKGLPVSVFRPAIVTNTRSEPMPGWIDNFYGPSGLLVGCAVGLIRVVWTDLDNRADFVPADMTVHAALAIAYKTYLMGPTNEILVYNFTPSTEHPYTLRDYDLKTTSLGTEIPTSKAVWYFMGIVCKNVYYYQLMAFLFHTVPAIIIDTALVLMNKKPQAMKIYRKIHKLIEILSYFTLNSWKFQNSNIQALLSEMNKEDRELFDFDMSRIDWDEYIYNLALGDRLYLGKDPIETLPQAKQKQFWLYILHITVLFLYFLSIGWLSWNFFHLLIFRLFTLHITSQLCFFLSMGLLLWKLIQSTSSTSVS